MRLLINISLFLIIPSSSEANGCSGLDKVAEMIQQGRQIHLSGFKKGSKAWDKEWNDWQTKITRELEASKQRDALAITKSIKRKLDQDALALEKQASKTQQPGKALNSLESKISKIFQVDPKAAKTIEAVKRSNPQIYARFLEWQKTIAETGTVGLRKISGYKDESLKFTLPGYRSSRLNGQWRVLYKEAPDGKITVMDIDPHSRM